MMAEEEEDVTEKSDISRFQVRNRRHWKRTAFFVKTFSVVQRDQEASLEAVSARKKKASSLEGEEEDGVVAPLLPEVVVRFAEDRIEAVIPSRSRSIFWCWYQFEETEILMLLVSTTLLF
jgi:hypothetical protein